MAYFLKQLNLVAQGWPSCLQAITCTTQLVKEEFKLTLPQPLKVLTSYQVHPVLDSKGHLWLTGSRLAQYQAVLLDTPDLTLKVCQNLNPATLFLSGDSEKLDHSYTETIEQVFSSSVDLQDSPLENPALEQFTDRNSFIGEGVGKAGYVTGNAQEITEAQMLAPTPAHQLRKQS